MAPRQVDPDTNKNLNCVALHRYLIFIAGQSLSFICKYRFLTLSIEAFPVSLTKRLSIIAGHAFLVGLSVLLAWLLRFEFHLPNLTLLMSAMPVLIFLRVVSLAKVGLLQVRQVTRWH